jgi:predicted nucleic acid-binding protein
MKIFLDANILVAVLCNEYPLFTHCSRVLSLSDDPGFEVYTSPLCLAIAWYFAEKKNGAALARKKIGFLSGQLKITAIDQAVVKTAASDKSVKDFEDGLQYYSAINAKCQCIVTEDRNDFYFSKIEVLTAEQFLLKYVVKKKR